MAAESSEMKKRCVEGSSRPDDPPVDDADAPVAQQHHVAGVHVAVEGAPAHRGEEEGAHHLLHQRRGIEAEVGHPGQVVDGDAVEELHRQHVAARELDVGLGHRHQLQVELVLQPAEVQQRARLVAQVHLLADLHPEAVEQLQRGAGHLVAGLAHQDLEEGLHEVEVGGHDVLDARSQHLDRHRAPVEQAGAVHDRDRGGPDRVGLELGEGVASDRPRSSSTRWRTSGNGTGGPVSRQARNSSATSSPNMPGDEAMIWPNFMKVPPRSWKLLRSGRASWAAGSGPCRMVRSWRKAVGVKWIATTLAIVRLRRSNSRCVGSGRRRG